MKVKLSTALLCATVGLGFGSTASAGSSSCESRNNNTTNKLLECVNVAGVREHQGQFQIFADATNGSRASGLGPDSAYELSAAYIASTMEAAGYDVTIQSFEFPFFEELSEAVLEQISPMMESYPYFDAAGFATMSYSGSGDVTAEVEGVDLQLPPGPVANSSTSGCEIEDFAGFTAGNIAAVQRGSCSFALKATNAEAAGAVGVIIFNEGQEGRTDAFVGTLGGPVITIPAVGAAFAVGEELAAGGVLARIEVEAISEIRETKNVLAESRQGSADNVVMAGAHLDSVSEGPGIQDNGSGSAAILEVAIQMQKVKPRNKVRFAWWGAEESGLLGSNHYVGSLSEEELNNITLYLNFDMIGSPNFARFIYDGDGSAFGLIGPPGSDVIETFFEDFYANSDLASEPTAFSGRSDYQAFILSGIPAGGLFTGAEGIKTADQVLLYGGTEGEQYDPCYHLACDTFDNVSLEVLDQNADAVAASVLQYAMSTETINGKKGKGNFKAYPGNSVDLPGGFDRRGAYWIR